MEDNTHTPTVDWTKGGTLHATFSLLVKHEQLTENHLGGLAEKIREKREEGKIAAVIEPMFDDISDRKRQVFSDEVLVDAGYGESLPHAMETISLIVPQEIHWCTEGTPWVYDSGDGDWEWSGIECRYLWFLHSNGDLSYHVSLKMPYQHTLNYYYALSLVQKLFFSSESPEDGYSLKVSGSEKREFRAFLRDKFENHFNCLLSHHPIGQPPASANWWSRPIKSLLSHHPISQPLGSANWWSRLIQDGTGEPHHVRAAFLLEDACFDHVLREREKRGYLTKLKEHMKAEPVSEGGVAVHQQNQNDTSKDCATPKTEPQLVAIPPKLERAHSELALLFLSGYLQNIIDFYEQDEAEFVDGTEPLYPKQLEDDPNFLLYATQDALFEVVRESRSLRSGSRCIGTCPYLFLVHVTLYHDEALVNRFASMMKELEKAVREKSGGYGNVENLSRKDLENLVENFRRLRLSIFAKVERFMHLNTFLYDTEQSFYKAVLEDRGIQVRLEHLTQLVSRLSETVGGLHEQAQQKATASLNVLVAAIGGLSVFQVLFAMSQAWRAAPDDDRLNMLRPWATPWDIFFTWGFFLVIFIFLVARFLVNRSQGQRCIKKKSHVPETGQPERKP